jgi:hypothetical protein
MNEQLLARYRKYARTDEAYAVAFVKLHLAEARGHWIDPVNFRRYEMSEDVLHFRYVEGGLFRRRLRPVYPPESDFTSNGRLDETQYAFVTRAITWEAAHKDIEQQKAAKVRPLRFEVTGVSYDRNKDNKNFFADDAPPEIKELAKNLSDRTNPLWDKALLYANRPEYVYEIRSARVITSVA